MRRLVFALIGALVASGYVAAQGQVKQHGRAIDEYRSPEMVAVAAYEYSQREHAGAWILIQFAVLTRERIAFHRDQITLLRPDEQRIRLATQQMFIDDQPELTRLLQNALIWRRPLEAYFRTRPQPTIRFFAVPGRSIVHDSAVSNQDEVASGDLFFKSPDGKWDAGTYRLMFEHDKARAALPIRLQ